MTDAPEPVAGPVDGVAPPRAGGPVGPAAAVALVVADLVAAFGYVVGFNQLATQSPVDAMLPVTLISVGLAGLLTTVAAVLGAERREVAPGDLLAPPSTEAGAAAFGLGLLAVAAVGWEWGTAAQAGLAAAAGLQLVLVAEVGVVLTVREAPARPHAARLTLAAAQAVLLLGFAGFGLADAGVAPFA